MLWSPDIGRCARYGKPAGISLTAKKQHQFYYSKKHGRKNINGELYALPTGIFGNRNPALRLFRKIIEIRIWCPHDFISSNIVTSDKSCPTRACILASKYQCLVKLIQLPE